MEAIAEVIALKKRFKSVEAVCDLSFTVRCGDLFGLIGPNGSGKTTTLRTLLGFYRPDSGSVRILGYNPASEFGKIGQAVGVMLEQPGMCSHLSASEYLDFYAGLLGLCRPDARKARSAALEIVGLATRQNDLLGGFSKGMSQKVSLARCLLSRPRLLVLDEPFDGVDVESRIEMRQLLVTLANQGIAVLVTSHNLSEIERICTQVAVIAAGKLVGLDSPQGFETSPGDGTRLVVVLDGDPDVRLIRSIFPKAEYDESRRVMSLALLGDSRESIMRSLLDNRIAIRSMNEIGETLEDKYLRLTRREG